MKVNTVLVSSLLLYEETSIIDFLYTVLFESFILQGFWYFAQSRSCEIQVNPRNPAKFTKTRKIPRNSVEILSNTCLYSNFETCHSYWGYLLVVNWQIYVKTSSLKRAHNVPKLPGVDYTVKISTKSAVFLPIAFWWSLPREFPRNSHEIGRFFRDFVPKNPAKFDFFFRDLSEALNYCVTCYRLLLMKMMLCTLWKRPSSIAI